METVYIETSIVSYLAAKPSRDLVLAGHQELTREWWQEQRHRYHCLTSDEVIREAALGDTEMSRRRLEILTGMAVLLVTDEARLMARKLIQAKLLPPAAVSDAIHAAVASLNRVEILLTWNCRHLANPHILPHLRAFVAEQGAKLPEICTPIELAGE